MTAPPPCFRSPLTYAKAYLQTVLMFTNGFVLLHVVRVIDRNFALDSGASEPLPSSMKELRAAVLRVSDSLPQHARFCTILNSCVNCHFQLRIFSRLPAIEDARKDFIARYISMLEDGLHQPKGRK
jgi:hypothetical protein